MSPQTRLVLGSVAFAVIWTLGMIWWTGWEAANIVVLSICGVVAGVLWYFAMRWWENRQLSRSQERL
jgi:hypothetical protein